MSYSNMLVNLTFLQKNRLEGLGKGLAMQSKETHNFNLWKTIASPKLADGTCFWHPFLTWALPPSFLRTVVKSCLLHTCGLVCF